MNERESTQILNSGGIKFNNEEVKILRDLMVSLATIEYDQWRENKQDSKE